MSIKFTDFLSESNILMVHGKDKKNAINEMLDLASRVYKLDNTLLHDAIWKREEQLSTAIGSGLAIPHARLSGLKKPIVLLGICPDKISDYCGIDKEPVSLIFLIISGNEDHQLYLDILQSVSGKLFKNKELIRKIRESKADGARIKALLKTSG